MQTVLLSRWHSKLAIIILQLGGGPRSISRPSRRFHLLCFRLSRTGYQQQTRLRSVFGALSFSCLKGRGRARSTCSTSPSPSRYSSSIFINLRSCGPKEAVLSLNVDLRGGTHVQFETSTETAVARVGRAVPRLDRMENACMYCRTNCRCRTPPVRGMQASGSPGSSVVPCSVQRPPRQGAGPRMVPCRRSRLTQGILYATKRSSPSLRGRPWSDKPCKAARVVAGCIFPASPRGARVRLNFFRCKSSPSFLFPSFSSVLASLPRRPTAIPL
jgi:hypothetical protein